MSIATIDDTFVTVAFLLHLGPSAKILANATGNHVCSSLSQTDIFVSDAAIAAGRTVLADSPAQATSVLVVWFSLTAKLVFFVAIASRRIRKTSL